MAESESIRRGYHGDPMTKWLYLLAALFLLGAGVLYGARTVHSSQVVTLVDVDGTTHTAWEE